MKTLIRLLPGQKNSVPLEPPFQLPNRVEKSELPDLFLRKCKGDLAARERLILGNVYLILNIVGRYLYYWKDAKPYEQDMISEGLCRLTELVDEIEDPNGYQWFVAQIIYKIQYSLEVLLNNTAIIHASFSTNRRRAEERRSIESYDGLPLSEYRSYTVDDGPAYVDIADAIERLAEADGEELVDLVLGIMQEKNTDNISVKQIQKIIRLVRGGV